MEHIRVMGSFPLWKAPQPPGIHHIHHGKSWRNRTNRTHHGKINQLQYYIEYPNIIEYPNHYNKYPEQTIVEAHAVGQGGKVGLPQLRVFRELRQGYGENVDHAPDGGAFKGAVLKDGALKGSGGGAKTHEKVVVEPRERRDFVGV